MDIFVYQNNEPPIYVIAPSMEEFLTNPVEHFPEVKPNFKASLERIEDYIIENNTVRKKEREEKILLDNKIDLLEEGEYIENSSIKVKQKPEGIYKYIWDKATFEWLEGLNLDEVKEVKRLEMKRIRDIQNEEDIKYQGNLFDGDLESKNKVFQASQIFKGEEVKVDWITADNKVTKLTGNDLEKIVILFSNREQELFTIFAEKLINIDVCRDVESVKKIKWEE